MSERLSLSSDRRDAADAAQEAARAFLSAWDDSWGYGGHLTVSERYRATEGRGEPKESE